MQFSVEGLESGVKNAFAGKKKWLWIGGVGVVVLVLFLKSRSSQSDAGTVYYDGYPQTSDYTGGSTGGGITSDDIALLRDNFSEALSTSLEKVNSRIDEVQTVQYQTAQSWGDSLAEINDTFGSALEGVNEKISGVDSKVQTALTEHAANNSVSYLRTEPTPVTAANVDHKTQNEITYLTNKREEGKATGNTGLAKWANQRLYYTNLIASGNDGQKKWATAQLAAMG
jgi:hypothetical protein